MEIQEQDLIEREIEAYLSIAMSARICCAS